MPRTRRAGSGRRAGRGTCAATNQGRYTCGDRLIHLLRTDEMNMAIDPARRQNLPFARDNLGSWADDDVDARLNIRIARFADLLDAPVQDRDVRLHDAPMIEDQRV